MTTPSDDRNLEARLPTWLHSAAPPAPDDLIGRVLHLTAAMPQRGTWSMRFALPGLAAAVVVAGAVVVGLQLGNIRPGGSGPFGSSSSATLTPTASQSTSVEPTASSSSPITTFQCENSVEGYAVQVPQDWFANPAITAPSGGDDVPACRYFAPAEFEVTPNAGLPPTVAIGFQLVESIGAADGTELSSTETTIDGHDALYREVAVTGAGPFLPAGTLEYEYYISLDDGTYLRISTDSSRDGDYKDHKAVMDQMMTTLDILP
jgi:hypothetical protein